MSFPQNFEIDYVRVYTKNAPCPIDKVISTSVNSNTYHQASNLITASSEVNSNLTVTLRADQVILKPGFKVSGNSTGVFRAYIDPCLQNTLKSNENQVSFKQSMNEEKSPFLYPNPTDGHLTIMNAENLVEWHIFDINGRNVLSQNNFRKSTFTIETNLLLPGLYFFKGIMKDGKLIQESIIKK